MEPSLKTIGIETAQQHIDAETAIFWFRRDLRLQDNAGLYHALRENQKVVLVFIFDDNILSQLEDIKDARITFIRDALLSINEQLHSLSTSLVVLFGDPVSIYRQLQPKSLYYNHDYEPYATNRDDKIQQIFNARNIPVFCYKDQVIFEKDEITKDNGSPYTIFTPYSNKWKAHVHSLVIKSFPTESLLSNLKAIGHLPMFSFAQIGFSKSTLTFPPRVIRQRVVENYESHRDLPATVGTTRLSVHLRFGTVSVRKLVQVGLKKSEKWLNELIWREFYQMILWHFPHVVTQPFKPAYEHIEWQNDESHFEAWCEGKTGYPLVDAGMRELNSTGFMHNRVRMVVASFLTKHLLIDWRWGEAYFAKKLLDFELASNNGGWQWAAGCGCDAAPYFRVFNPQLQMEKFDPRKIYVKRWVPEVESHDYLKPIVDHSMARERVIKVYKAALQLS